MTRDGAIILYLGIAIEKLTTSAPDENSGRGGYGYCAGKAIRNAGTPVDSITAIKLPRWSMIRFFISIRGAWVDTAISRILSRTFQKNFAANYH